MLLPISDKYFCLRLQTAVFAFVAAIFAGTSSAKTSKAVWWWRSEDAARVDVSEKRLDFLAEHGVNEIYFWADLKKYPKETRALVKAAGKKGMRVALLSGDVSWIRPENRGFAEVLAAYLAYQKSAASDERFYALHLDVEPHQDRKLSDKRKWQLYADFVLRASADLTWNRKAFDSERNWCDGIKRLYPFAPEAMLRFCSHNTDPHKNPEVLSGFYRDESRSFSQAWKAQGKAALVRECEANAAAAEELAKVLPQKAPELWREIRWWVAYFGAQAREGLAAAKGDAAAYVAAKDAGVEIQRKQKEYFQSLAPEWDRRRCTGCVTGTRHLQKAIDTCARESFRSSPETYERYFPTVGTTIGTVAGVAGKGQHFEKGESLIVLDEILEQMSAGPGDWFGLKMAKFVTFNYIWLNFETKDAVAAGHVEVSKDLGKTWQKIDLTVEGSLVHGSLDSAAGYNAVRWINRSERPVVFKIVRFNVDVVK